MGACRRGYNLWFHIKKVFKPYSKYHGRLKCLEDLLRLRMDNAYFWHDSFGRYFNQVILCPLIGHRHVQWLDDGGCSNERPSHYCVNCEQEVDPGIDKIREKTSSPA